MRLPPVREGGRRVSRTETVPASWREITALGERLLADGVEVVVMESTSDYWRIWYYLLEAAGLAVQLVSPSHARQLAGRPKTGRLDCQWLARLAEMGPRIWLLILAVSDRVGRCRRGAALVSSRR